MDLGFLGLQLGFLLVQILRFLARGLLGTGLSLRFWRRYLALRRCGLVADRWLARMTGLDIPHLNDRRLVGVRLELVCAIRRVREYINHVDLVALELAILDDGIAFIDDALADIRPRDELVVVRRVVS